MSHANAGIMDNIDARTQLVGHNRLELLLFRLSGKQRYGINVFKVREVVSCPPLNKLPSANPAVKGVATIRGNTFVVVDLQHALGGSPVESTENCSVIVTEYNRKIQGFLVPHIEHIINKHWEEITPPPKIAGKNHYLTAVTQVDSEIVEILDVEKVLYEITGSWGPEGNKELDIVQDETAASVASRCHVLIADDSSVARNQLKRTLSSMGINCTVARDGQEAFDILSQWAKDETEEYKRLALIISDVEMPNMDGYTLTNAIRSNVKYDDVKILLHTSLSGVFDSSLLERVKADGFLAKFDSEELSEVINKHITDFIPFLEERGL